MFYGTNRQTGWTLDRQTAQHVGRMAVVLDAREPLLPRASVDLGRRRGHTGWLPDLCVPALPARLVQLHIRSTASWNRGANGSESER